MDLNYLEARQVPFSLPEKQEEVEHGLGNASCEESETVLRDKSEP